MPKMGKFLRKSGT